MAETKYGKYIVDTLKPPSVEAPWSPTLSAAGKGQGGRVLYMDNDVVPGAFYTECVWIMPRPAGTGPGGATVGRELTRAGKRVVFVEGGRHPTRVGSHFSMAKYTDRAGLVYSEEGLNVVRALATGGSTLVFTATACRPPEWLNEKYGIDLTYEVNEAEEELKRHRDHLEELVKESDFVITGVGD